MKELKSTNLQVISGGNYLSRNMRLALATRPNLQDQPIHQVPVANPLFPANSFVPPAAAALQRPQPQTPQTSHEAFHITQQNDPFHLL